MPHSIRCRPRGRLAACAWLLALSLAACAERAPARASASAVSVRDDVGRAISLHRPAARVLSLIPAQTEVIRQLAGVEVLVARTQWDTDPALAHLPSTENALSPSVEWVAALQPDLVVAWPDQSARNVIGRLESIGIPVYASAVESLADIDTMIVRFGVLLGREARADSLVRAVHASLDSVRTRVSGRARPRVLYAVSIDPPMPATNATFLGELVGIAGGENIFSDLTTLWPQVSLEEVVRRAPDVIVRPVEDTTVDVLAQLRARAGWRDLPAVRDGRVHVVDVNLLNRPGVRIGEAAEVLARAIHPDAFAR